MDQDQDGKTRHTAFRLDAETFAQLHEIALHYSRTTGGIVTRTAAVRLAVRHELERIRAASGSPPSNPEPRDA